MPSGSTRGWATKKRLVLGQEATDAKSNEITAIPLLLERLELRGALVTNDAMGTQTKIAQKILDRGGDYLLALKENWPATYAEVETLFVKPPPEMTIERHRTVESRYPGEFKFPRQAMLGMVQSTTERNGKTEHETRYYLCSTELDAKSFARAVRGHWGIENRLHWLLDVVFREDLTRLRSGDGPENMAVVRHTALNMLSQATPITSCKNRRKKPGWEPDHLEQVLRRAA